MEDGKIISAPGGGSVCLFVSAVCIYITCGFMTTYRRLNEDSVLEKHFHEAMTLNSILNEQAVRLSLCSRIKIDAPNFALMCLLICFIV